MVQYERAVGPGAKTKITGKKCDRCGFTLLDDDGDIWSAVGL
jgi:uncharacterized Zn finger protein (UPF0148 family)